MASDSAAKEPRRNVRIGKYEVVAHIATGGMGAVYKAHDTENGRDVALKVLSPEMAAKPAMLERFRREARHAAKLRHKNIVTLYEFGEINSTCFLVLEFIDGVDLHEYSNRHGPLDPEEALDIIVQGCRALDHAYRQGVIHRDIKPSNFLIAQDGERNLVKLTDLGLAREVNDEEFRVTRAGTTVGTLDYMAPEQSRDSGLADIRSDLYSLGSTWYHLLAGHPPFPKGGLGERLHRILNELPSDIRQFNARVSEAMAAVVHRLLAKRPSQRYQTPAELLDDLEALKTNQPVLTSRQVLEDLAQMESAAEPPRKKDHHPKQGRRTPRSLPTRPKTESEARQSTDEVPIPADNGSTRPYLWYGLGGTAALVILVGLVLVLALRRGHHKEPLAEQTSTAVTQPQQSPVADAKQSPVANAPGSPPLAKPKKPTWPLLYPGAKKIDVAALRKEVEAPWATPASSGPTVELIVGRLPDDPSGKTFRSLADACKAIPAGATGVIELRDNGPFFALAVAVADRHVILRAAAGYRPLLIWDVPRMLEQRRKLNRRDADANSAAPIFLDVKHGNLTLQDLHIALQWPDAPSAGASLVHVEDGDLTVSGCTFSVAGKPRDGMTLARLTGTHSDASRYRFTRCYCRGAGLSVLDADAPGARLLFEDCLLVGGDAPLLR
ncbi:MAG: serine/threonine-protein kinase, partial [Gemmataceae bacterium]